MEMATYRTYQVPQHATLFPNLPLELRELIYQYVVPLPSSDISPPRLLISAADVMSGSDPRFPPWLPPVARVSHGTRIDVALYILRQVEVYIPYRQTLGLLGRFLGTLPIAQGQGAIQRLNFPSFGAARLVKGWETVFIDFAKSCPQLRTVQIGINAPDMRKVPEPNSKPNGCYSDAMLDAEEVLEVYDLVKLTELTNLVAIFVELCPLYNGKPVSGCVVEVKKAASLVRDMFKSCGHEIHVLVIDFRGKQWDEDTHNVDSGA